jgi:hypothetical protein
MATTAQQRMWRYSLRWSNPHTQPTGPYELAQALVPAGSDTPAEIRALWQPGMGYAICIDFDDIPIKKWSAERKGKARRTRLDSRLQKVAPLFADEFRTRELAARPAYFRGE